MRAAVLAAWIVAAIAIPAGYALHSGLAAAAPAQAGGRCANVQLTVGFQGGQGAAGTITSVLRLHNLSARACTLYGYPGVQLLDKNFLTIPTTVHRGLTVGKPISRQLVQVAAHGNAYFALEYNDVPVGNQPCETAKYLMVFAPNDILPVVTYAAPHGGKIYPCSGNIYVSPVTAQPHNP